MAFAGPIYSFENVIGNSLLDAAIGEAQLAVEVIDPGAGQVYFLFSNTGPDPSSITDIYFDNGASGTGSLAAIALIDDSNTGVSFSAGANPGNLPGSNNTSPSFQTTVGLSLDSDSPVQPNGVNPGETLGVLIDLRTLPTAATYSDVLDELDIGSLRIGLHVQGFTSGGSEGFVTAPPVPAPGAILLGTIGLVLVRSLRQRGALI